MAALRTRPAAPHGLPPVGRHTPARSGGIAMRARSDGRRVHAPLAFAGPNAIENTAGNKPRHRAGDRDDND